MESLQFCKVLKKRVPSLLLGGYSPGGHQKWRWGGSVSMQKHLSPKEVPYGKITEWTQVWRFLNEWCVKTHLVASDRYYQTDSAEKKKKCGGELIGS